MRYIGLFFKNLGFCGFILFTALNLVAQESSRISAGSALVYHVEGEDFAITLAGEQTIYTAEAILKEGLVLERSGIVHTGAGTFLEIQLVPSGTVIKMAENTSLIYNGIDDNGEFVDLGLLYGRIRVVTGESCCVVIRGGGVSAKVLKGDFGADYMMEPDSLNSTPRPLFCLYTFRGSAEVFPYGKGATAFFGGARNLTTESGECLSLDISSSYTFAERKPTDRAIVAYWEFHKFAGSPPVSMPDTTIAAAQNIPLAAITARASSAGTVSVPPPASQPMVKLVPDEQLKTGLHQPAVNSNRTKNLLATVGLGLMVSSVAIQSITHYSPNTFPDGTAVKVHHGMYGPLGLGVYLTLMGIIYNPSSPVK